jgi:hypothetical protein
MPIGKHFGLLDFKQTTDIVRLLGTGIGDEYFFG